MDCTWGLKYRFHIAPFGGFIIKMVHKHKWQYARTTTVMHNSPDFIETINVFVCECGAVKEVKEK